MTSSVGRLYAIAGSIVVFFLLWMLIAAAPWAPRSTDPRLAALAAREQLLQAQTAVVRKVVNERWAAYRRSLARMKSQSAATPAPSAPTVRVVTLPPLTITKTS
jgi:hypothetical protein